MPDIRIQKWVETFHKYRFDKLTLDPLFKRALLILKDAWLRCIKEDVTNFTTAYYLTPSPTPSANGSEDEEDDDEDVEAVEQILEEEDEEREKQQKLVIPATKKERRRTRSPDTQIKISHDTIYIKRPWLSRFVPSVPEERQERLLQAFEDAMTDEERQRIRAEKLERLRKIEENRKKALKAARERQLKQAQGRSVASTSDKTAQTRRRDAGLYIDRVLPSKTATMSKDSQHLFLNDFQRYMRTSKTAPPKFDIKLTFLFDAIKVCLTNSRIH